MFFRRNRPEPDAVEVILGARASFAGTLRSETSVRIDGSVAGGLIETPANVLITESARVVCEIVAHVVSIRGSFEGAIRADRVEMLAGSQVAGLIHTGSLFKEEGALLTAEVRMRDGTRIPGVGNTATDPKGERAAATARTLQQATASPPSLEVNRTESRTNP
jgi:cytoskeletal protein CcmA (bactofilin family)